MEYQFYFVERPVSYFSKGELEKGLVKNYRYDCIVAITADNRTTVINGPKEMFELDLIKGYILEENGIDTGKLNKQIGAIYKIELDHKMFDEGFYHKIEIEMRLSPVRLKLRDGSSFSPSMTIKVSAMATYPSYPIEELRKFFESHGAEVTVVNEHPMNEHELEFYEKRLEGGYKLFEDTKVTLIAQHEPWGG